MSAFALSRFETPCGPMVAVADECALYLLEFAGRDGLERVLEQYPIAGAEKTAPLYSIEQELAAYFCGRLREFHTPICLRLEGSSFQKSVWEVLRQIPYGETRSYADVATAVGRHTGVARAVAQAARANRLALIVPCHRVIYSGGGLGGYAGGVAQKEWLLKHEGSGPITTER